MCTCLYYSFSHTPPSSCRMSIPFPIYHCLGCLEALLLTFNFEYHESTSTFRFSCFSAAPSPTQKEGVRRMIIIIIIITRITRILSRCLESVCRCLPSSQSAFFRTTFPTILDLVRFSMKTSSPTSVKLCRPPAKPFHNRGSPLKTHSKGTLASNSFVPSSHHLRALQLLQFDETAFLHSRLK
jgi:hypothetical protein